VITVDSSVLIPGLRQSHPAHAVARAALRQPGLRLVAHVTFETFAHLTRSRPRVHPQVVLDALRMLDEQPVALSGEVYLDTLRRCVDGALIGGAVYDALIAATAREAGLRLVSLDLRAARTYATMRADYELLPA
jgi:predicted nucleic acid-binding protein